MENRSSKVKQHSFEDVLNSRVKKFQKLMRYKIREILLVSSIYDNYLFEEDGRLYELVREEYQSLNLSFAPELIHVTTGEEALEMLSTENTFDLIITTLHIEDMHVVKFARMVRKSGINLPIVLLAYDNRERKELTTNYDTSIFERIFIWNGDYRLLIGIVKYIEDRVNVENDTKNIGVQSIIVVEDNIKFYSSYLPIIYTEVFKQSQRLIKEGINLTHKFLRMRARPKILLCTNYEDAWSYYEKYQQDVLGLILDINFKHNGVKDPEAGIKFARAVKAQHKDIPILLQSSDDSFREKAYQIDAAFVHKNSPRLLQELREFMLQNFGFGDFIFINNDGKEVFRASNLSQLEEALKRIPDESLVYHASRNHFSKWLKARTEFYLAHELRPHKVTDFGSVQGLRDRLLTSLQEYRKLQQSGIILDFNKDIFDTKNSFARIGGGSLGGKARGLGFINILLTNYNLKHKFDGVEISVPSAIVIGTDVFDHFITDNKLENFAITEIDDLTLTQKFVDSKIFPEEITNKLREFLEITHCPLAVRSSSLLEDSQFLPFAGVYETYMIPNSNPDIEIRLDELLQSIKSVYASTFHLRAKDYIKSSPYRLEEEKMAVVVQRLVGAKRQERFYPDFAGVAKSYNFYPTGPQKPGDGIAQAALGLGKTVVDGGNCIRFCPKYPKHMLQFFSTKETLKTAQQKFYALDLNKKLEHHPESIEDQLVRSYDLSDSEKDGTLFSVGSTYSSEDEAVFDGLSRDGIRVVTFAPILKHKLFPLPEILDLLLDFGSWGMGTPIEIEFAVNLEVPAGERKEFAMLQMRPMILSRESEELVIGEIKKDETICYSTQVLGNGAVTGLMDIIVVDYEKFNRAKSNEVVLEISKLNAKLLSEKRPYILFGVGRWGTLDPWLGIPVKWDQISGASVIVESSFKDFAVEPSQGSHFFQNLTSFRVGYFTVNTDNNSFIDWQWLSEQNASEEMIYTRHLRFDQPITVRMNGHENRGIIYKPGVRFNEI
ncbi:MAG: PEP/pyruvate-binding domain-containing protein [Ignavibacterium sp.]|jgi:CheY-like chemotaxis protein|nr:PEP/pyruvate-binding domain-containing protein [Ignavibacterium sp.]